jgi:hypothetical protein
VEQLRRISLACACLLACSIGGASPAIAAKSTKKIEARQKTESRQAEAIAWLGERVAGYQRLTWRWQRLMGVPRTPTAGRVGAEMSVPDVRKAVVLWQRHARTAQRRAARPPHLRAFLCIHRYEGNWSDGGAPYYGGLQMDLGFQRTYASWLVRTKGTADHWTPLEQIWTAEKALRSRGFWPWPNSARFCGLL